MTFQPAPHAEREARPIGLLQAGRARADVGLPGDRRRRGYIMQDRPIRERNSKRKPTSHTPTQWVLGEGTLGGRGLYSPERH